MSEGAGVAPQLTCGIPRSRFGLVWLVPLDQVVISEESRVSSVMRASRKGFGGGWIVRDDVLPVLLLEQARSGNDVALGALLELYRNYLRLVARSLISSALRVKLEPSDLVQETFLKAHREFTQFAGQSEPELVSWLRRILVRSRSNQVKHHRRMARDHLRQESLEQLLDRSSSTIQQALATSINSPSEQASRRCFWPTP